MLDRIAHRYHSDPLTIVETWSPQRIGLAKLCLDAREQAVKDRCERMSKAGSSPMATIDVGS